MKRVILLLLLIVVCGMVQAQIKQSENPSAIFVIDIQGKPLTEKNIVDYVGSPFLMDEWHNGSVKFKNGRFAEGVLLKFDLHHNRLYFQRNDIEFEFIQAVSEFALNYTRGADSFRLAFRSGFPAVGSNTENTFYEVVLDGKIKLLNYHSKYIFETKPYNEPLKREFRERHLLYALLPDGNMVLVKRDKDDLAKDMPGYAAAINKIVTSKKLKLKKDEHVVELFTALNQ